VDNANNVESPSGSSASDEEIVAAKSGVVQVPPTRTPANAVGVTFVARDFDALDPAIEELFGSDD
jgi:hypothetical protein